jgi:hypothetical protein
MSNFGEYQQNVTSFDKNWPKIRILIPGIELRRKVWDFPSNIKDLTKALPSELPVILPIL